MRVNEWEIRDVGAEEAISQSYDVAVWAAGYEERGRWLIGSEYRPRTVQDWYRIEFEEERDALAGPTNRAIGLGEVLGGIPGRRFRDGEWLRVWVDMALKQSTALGRGIDAFIDLSSMSRAIYGTALLAAIRFAPGLFRSLTFAYVPGRHAENIEGSRQVDGLRPLLGTEGILRYDAEPAYILGLGCDGIMARALVEIFQMNHFSSLLGGPGVTAEGEARAVTANADLLMRSELIARAPAFSAALACNEIIRLTEWYAGARDVVVIPMGPKPHVVGAILASLLNRDLAMRWVMTSHMEAVDVMVPEGAIPWFCSCEMK